MKKNVLYQAVSYTAPAFSIAEVSVEKGFAASEASFDTYDVDIPDYGEGATLR